jgi:hypothetical protein
LIGGTNGHNNIKAFGVPPDPGNCATHCVRTMDGRDYCCCGDISENMRYCYSVLKACAKFCNRRCC